MGKNGGGQSSKGRRPRKLLGPMNRVKDEKGKQGEYRKGFGHPRFLTAEKDWKTTGKKKSPKRPTTYR